MQRILKEYTPELEKAGFGLPFLYEKLIEAASKGEQVVLVLDEIDMVKDLDELVYTMTRSNDEMKKGGVEWAGGAAPTAKELFPDVPKELMHDHDPEHGTHGHGGGHAHPHPHGAK